MDALTRSPLRVGNFPTCKAGRGAFKFLFRIEFLDEFPTLPTFPTCMDL
jgi:hypothetical protein